MTVARFTRRLFIITMCILWLQTPQPLSLTVAAQSQPAQSQPPQTTFDCSTVSEIPQLECEALVAIYEHNGGPNWTNTTGWLAIDTPCQWFGVACRDGHIVELNLFGSLFTPFGLTGRLPAEIGNLSNLSNLALYHNHLTEIPVEVGNLSNLSVLELPRNQLTEIPVEIGNLSNLSILYLDNNQLAEIPIEIGNLSNLSKLTLNNNQLTDVPVEIGNLSNLFSLYLSSNQLTEIPVEIGNLSNLSRLALYNNQLTEIPAEIGNLSNLSRLDLENNQLTEIPVEIGDLAYLSFLYLTWNRLPHLPDAIENHPSIQSFTSWRWSGSPNEGELSTQELRWMATQTIVPTDFTASPQPQRDIQFSWSPIAFQGEGYYEISLSTNGSTFEVSQTSADKSTDSILITGLEPETTYHAHIRTYTAPHTNQPSGLWSEYSDVVIVTTLSNADNTEGAVQGDIQHIFLPVINH
ncbi:MAG: leucine-rich repeat domain-containing protein [Chloroflexota bacterium]